MTNIKRFRLSVDGLLHPDANQKFKFNKAPPTSPKRIKTSIMRFSFFEKSKKSAPNVSETAVRNSPHIIRLPKIFEFGITEVFTKSLYHVLGFPDVNLFRVGERDATNFPPVIFP